MKVKLNNEDLLIKSIIREFDKLYQDYNDTGFPQGKLCCGKCGTVIKTTNDSERKRNLLARNIIKDLKRSICLKDSNTPPSGMKRWK